MLSVFNPLQTQATQPAIGWRAFETTLLAAPQNGNCQYDAYLWDPDQVLRTVYTAPAGNRSCRSGLDMAGNGMFGVGIWPDMTTGVLTDTLAPMTDFNLPKVYSTFLRSSNKLWLDTIASSWRHCSRSGMARRGRLT